VVLVLTLQMHAWVVGWLCGFTAGSRSWPPTIADVMSSAQRQLCCHVTPSSGEAVGSNQLAYAFLGSSRPSSACPHPTPRPVAVAAWGITVHFPTLEQPT